MGNYGESWGIMGNYGMSFGVLLIVVFCRRMAPCFHRHVRLSSSQQCSLCATRLPIQGPQGIHFPAQLAKQMKKLNIKALNPNDIGLSVAGGRRGGAWMWCAAALNVLPPRHRAACASAFAEAATAASLPAAGTCDAAADGAPPATADAVTADNAAYEPPEQPVASSAVPPGDTLAALDWGTTTFNARANGGRAEPHHRRV